MVIGTQISLDMQVLFQIPFKNMDTCYLQIHYLVNQCPKLSGPSYGSVTVSGLEVGSTATYQCDDGFLLVGSSTRYCQQYGDWSGEAPICNCELILN